MAQDVRIYTKWPGIKGYLLFREMAHMVRKFAALFALVLTFSLAAMPVAAQDINAEDMDEFGLNSGYLRMYMADPAGATATDVQAVMVAGFQFESDKTADKAFEDFTCGFAGGFMGITDASDCDGLVDAGLDVADVDGIGDQAIEISGEADIAGATPTGMLAVQDGEFIFLVITLGDSTPGVGDDMAKFLVAADPSDVEVEFVDDGTSTGGFYDMLPQDGDAEIDGLLPMMDMDFFGSSSSTPAS